MELDVLGRPDRTLVLGHSHRELGAEFVTLEELFAFLADRSPQTGLLADVKGSGFELELVESLRRHDLVERAVACGYRLSTLRTLRRLEPALVLSRTYPPSRLRVCGRSTFVPIVGPVRAAMRLALPFRIGNIVGEAEASATTLAHRLVTRAVVERCHSLGVAVLAWTVNDRSRSPTTRSPGRRRRDLRRSADLRGLAGYTPIVRRRFGFAVCALACAARAP